MTMNQVAIRESGAIVEQVLLKGDLASLNPKERVEYYRQVCESVGLNPLTKPFEYITLNGKLTLYALRGATDQLRALHKVSVTDMTEAERDGVAIVTVKVQNSEGRTDMAKGAVTIANLKGDALANAFMKAETKAKRRATLSICGLGFLDETEIETINGAVPQRSSYRLKQEGGDDVFKSLVAKVGEAKTAPELRALHKEYAMTIASWGPEWQASFETEVYDARLAELEAERRAKPKNGAKAEPAELSEADSAALLKALLHTLGVCESQTALKEWVRDKETKASIRSLNEADYQSFEDGYETRMNTLPSEE